MEITTIYATVLGSLAVFAALQNIVFGMLIGVCCKLLGILRENLLYRLVCVRRRGSTDLRMITGLALMVLVAGNVTASVVATSGTSQIARRLAKLSMINIVLLYLGGGTGIILGKVFGWSLSTSAACHRWLGRVVVVEAIAHGVIEMLSLKTIPTYVHITMYVLLSLLGLLSVLWIRRYAYEIFQKTHLVFSIGLLIMLWLHIPLRKDLATICLITATALWTLQQVAWFTSLAYRNWWSGGSIVCKLEHLPGTDQIGATRIILQVNKSCTILPGQYVYLTLRGTSSGHLTQFQAHPYLVAWTGDEHNDNFGKWKQTQSTASHSITVVVGHQKGFSNDIRRCRDDRQEKYIAILDGPYGQMPKLDRHDTILFLAKGVGLVAHLMPIRYLLSAHNDKSARVRRITLAWELEDEIQEEWFSSYLKFLSQDEFDKRHIFNILICSASHGKTAGEGAFQLPRDGSRVRRLNSTIDIGKLLALEWFAEAGDLALSVCGSAGFEDSARRAVRAMRQSQNSIYTCDKKEAIYFLNSDFQSAEIRAR